MLKVKMINQKQLLKQIDKDISKAQLAEMNIPDKMADLVVAGAKRRVPVVTGNLKSKIYKRKYGKGTVVMADTDYAALVEYGSIHNKSKPYMQPALEEAEKQLEEIVDKEMGV